MVIALNTLELIQTDLARILEVVGAVGGARGLIAEAPRLVLDAIEAAAAAALVRLLEVLHLGALPGQAIPDAVVGHLRQRRFMSSKVDETGWKWPF